MEKKKGLVSKNKDGSFHITFEHWRGGKHIIDSSVDVEKLYLNLDVGYIEVDTLTAKDGCLWKEI